MFAVKSYINIPNNVNNIDSRLGLLRLRVGSNEWFLRTQESAMYQTIIFDC